MLQEIDLLPSEKLVLALEWPAELGLPEERVVLSTQSCAAPQPLYMFELTFQSLNSESLRFALETEDENIDAQFELRLDAQLGFRVTQNVGAPLMITIGRRTILLDAYLTDCPPLVRFVDLSELDGNLLIQPRNPKDIALNSAQFQTWRRRATGRTAKVASTQFSGKLLRSISAIVTTPCSMNTRLARRQILCA